MPARQSEQPTGPPLPGPEAASALAPGGVLRVGVNLSNFLLVSGIGEDGEPIGVSPSMAKTLATALAVPVDLVAFSDPGDVVDAVAAGTVDVGNVGADPTRAEHVFFTSPYCEIEATYLVRESSAIGDIDEVDRPGVRVASRRNAAYTLWLDRNIVNAEVIHADTIDASFEVFVAEELEVLAGLRPRLLDDAERVPGTRLLDGRFTSVRQAIGISRERGPAAHSYAQRFVDWAIRSGTVADSILDHGVKGLSVADPSGR